MRKINSLSGIIPRARLRRLKDDGAYHKSHRKGHKERWPRGNHRRRPWHPWKNTMNQRVLSVSPWVSFLELATLVSFFKRMYFSVKPFRFGQETPRKKQNNVPSLFKEENAELEQFIAHLKVEKSRLVASSS
ncbi:hypothetical protein RUM43_012237 [Polyplax serrata]|uniref:Uncharacterized protein n=1 Tax=Polyplax serrata TaxID=468196 RepID=A0AAN8RZA4_POLSC